MYQLILLIEVKYFGNQLLGQLHEAPDPVFDNASVKKFRGNNISRHPGAVGDAGDTAAGTVHRPHCLIGMTSPQLHINPGTPPEVPAVPHPGPEIYPPESPVPEIPEPPAEPGTVPDPGLPEIEPDTDVPEMPPLSPE